MPTITLDPMPPVQGKSLKITTTANTVVHLDWDPAAEPTSATTGSDGTVTITVPSNATSLVYSTNGSNEQSTTVSPP